MGSMREGLGRLGYRSVTHPEARPPAGRDLGALPYASDRAVLALSATFVRSGSATSPRTTRKATSSPTSA
jgi:hypothetical protein